MKKPASVWDKYNGNPFFDEYQEGSMFQCLKRSCEKFSSDVALDYIGKKTTYSELLSNIERCAKAFYKLGVRKGDYITFVTINTSMAITAIYAANRIGAVCNMLHPMLSQEETKKFIEDVNSKVVFTFDAIYPKYKKYEFKEGMNPTFVVTPIQDGFPWIKKKVYEFKNKVNLDVNPDHNLIMWKEFLKGVDDVVLPEDTGKADDPAVIMYSGGSTGIPKGCITTNLSMNVLAYSAVDCGATGNYDRVSSLVLMPVFHSFGLGISVHSMLCCGSYLHVIPKYDMEETVKLIFKKKVQAVYGVPALFQTLIRSPYIDKTDLSFLKQLVSGGDKLPVSLLNRINSCLEKGGAKVKLLEAYGQTENNSGACMNAHFDYVVGSCGIPMPGCELKICKLGTDEEVKPGETGEICFNSLTLMKGYLNNPEETAKVLKTHTDGKVWLHTFDLGHLDEGGHLYFDGRASRLLITAGYNVYPQEIERILDSLPYVEKSCVIGLKDKIVGERIVAHIVLGENAKKEENSDEFKKRIMEHLKMNVAEYSLPQEIILKDDLPMTSLGKVDFRKVTEEAENAR